MAKKQSTPPAEAADQSPAAPAAEAPAGGEGKKAKEPKAKEAKPKEAKGKTDPAAEAPPVPAGTAPAAPAPGEPAAKKKGKRPGTAPRRGKKLKNQLKNIRQKIAKEGPAPLKKALALLKQVKRAKFDETVEVHMWLGIDPSQNDQMVRGSVALPHGIGKAVRVVVFCQGDNVAKARDAGADEAGSDELIKKIQGGWLDFDVALATQDMMGQVSRLGKVLGPRGRCRRPRPAPSSPAAPTSAARSRSSRPARSSTAPTRAATSTPASAR
jgi:large subunit ribosomal protein L1